MTEPELGTVAISRAGHDKGGAFIILGRQDTNYVLLADGKNRKVARPKRKKLSHVHVEPAVAQAVRDLLLGGKLPTDADIRKALKALGYQGDTE